MVDRRGDRRLDRGQATVEAVVVLPVIVVVLLALVQVGLVLRDHVAVTTAARAAARVAVVEPDTAAVRRAAIGSTGLRSDRVLVSLEGDASPGSLVTVRVRYREAGALPLVGRLVDGLVLEERVVVMVE
ncbi:MAG: pilus assembly protein [Microthrixaceae bacterium]|nr:pilus assembly protein [Microthrixaceae bacterium]